MNKKIKIIEIFKLIAKGEQVPKKIKSEDKEFYFQEDEASIDYLYRTDKNGNGWLVVQDLALNDEVEILEDNTEEIEELDVTKEEIDSYDDIDLIIQDRLRINELVRAVKKLQKESEDKQ